MNTVWRDAAERYEEGRAERHAAAYAKDHLTEPGQLSKYDDLSRIEYRLRTKGYQGRVQMDGDRLAPEAAEKLKRIIAGELLSSYYLIQGENARRTVARVVGNYADRPWMGSGFLVSPTLFMTNNHVLPSESVAREADAEFDYVEAPIGTPEDLQIKAKTYTFRPDKFFITSPRGELDYTIVSLEPEMDARTDVAGFKANLAGLLALRGWNQLIDRSGKVLPGERVNIIQHPLGRHQEVALRGNEVVALDRDADKYIWYRADTQMGSSGSPVWSDDWKLAALHHAAIPAQMRNGQAVMKDGTLWSNDPRTEHLVEWKANEGVRISRIVEDLESRIKKRELTGEKRKLIEECFQPVPLSDLDKAQKIVPMLEEIMAQVIEDNLNPKKPGKPADISTIFSAMMESA